ncbi:MAG: rRNA maturation RNase YbeY [Bacteroidales bacterium]|jgi:rRNA maturation RNase YbeY|nr:rRNA maturation RNase YbeY [Bacteroidales bacterium]
MSIEFFCEDVEKPRVKYIALRKWIKDVVEEHKKTVGKISFVFCSDEHLLKMNNEYLKHDYYTDVLTFDNTEDDKISGEVYISVDRVAENAKTYSTEDTEIFRVVIHSVLHMLGYDDTTPESQEQMRAAEDKCLAMPGFKNCKWLKDSKQL